MPQQRMIVFVLCLLMGATSFAQDAKSPENEDTIQSVLKAIVSDPAESTSAPSGSNEEAEDQLAIDDPFSDSSPIELPDDPDQPLDGSDQTLGGIESKGPTPVETKSKVPSGPASILATPNAPIPNASNPNASTPNAPATNATSDVVSNVGVQDVIVDPTIVPNATVIPNSPVLPCSSNHAVAPIQQIAPSTFINSPVTQQPRTQRFYYRTMDATGQVTLRYVDQPVSPTARVLNGQVAPRAIARSQFTRPQATRGQWIVQQAGFQPAAVQTVPNGVLPNSVLPNTVLQNTVLQNTVLPNGPVQPRQQVFAQPMARQPITQVADGTRNPNYGQVVSPGRVAESARTGAANYRQAAPAPQRGQPFRNFVRGFGR